MKMGNWENNIRKVVPYTPGEQPKNTCVIKLNTNENPYPPAPGVKEVLSNFNTDDLRLYPDPRVDKLVNAIADFYKIDSSKVFVGTMNSSGFREALGNPALRDDRAHRDLNQRSRTPWG